MASASQANRQILYIDAYDSFAYNVVAMLEETLGVDVTVMTIDCQWPNNDMAALLEQYDAVVLGPGPGNPTIATDVGIMADVWGSEGIAKSNSSSSSKVVLSPPVLGVCLGFQSLCLYGGVPVQRLPYPLHGQVRRISSAQTDIFAGMPGVDVTLYHSLYARPPTGASLGELDLLAWLDLDLDQDLNQGLGGPRDEHFYSAVERVPMAVRHKSKPFWGFQFHPESCKSDRVACDELLKRWWQAALEHNRLTGRETRGCSFDISPVAAIPNAYESSSLYLGVAATMLKWSSSSSSKSANRSLPANGLSAETICEVLNTPHSPTVLFHSNGRHSVISVVSPNSWRLEYDLRLGRLALELLSHDSSQQTSTTLTANHFWDSLRYFMEKKRVTMGNPVIPFWGGFLGYFSYEMGLACLSHPKTPPGSGTAFPQTSTVWSEQDYGADNAPDASLLYTERSVVLDNKTKQITIQSTVEADDRSNEWLDQTLRLLSELTGNRCSADAVPAAARSPYFRRTDDADGTDFLDSILSSAVIQLPDEKLYKKQVEACKAQLKAGESYELCLTCETPVTLRSPTARDDGRASFPWKLYKRLRKYNPAAFSAYAKLGNVKIASSSPECFLNWDRESMLEMKPMKGTVRKSASMTLERAKEILGSTKEMAENLMIADLIRHDLYGICGAGRVRVEKLLEVEDHGLVYQMITHVRGEIDHRRPGVAVRHMPQLKCSANMSVHGITALQKCLPPGSMTGAPKERSCMHLSAIEARKRGIYSGVMGFLDLGGAGSFSVLIRTAFSSTDDQSATQLWRVGAGGAVTALSTAQGEWEEMLTKLRTVCNIFKPLKSDADG